MRPRYILLAALILFSMLMPVRLTAASDQQPEPTDIPVQDSRSGDGPCGFSIQRDLEGTIRVLPSLDDRGNLVLVIEDVDLYGTITNPDNGQSVEIQWVRQSGRVAFEANGSSTHVLLQLTGNLNRGYDTANSDLTMDLPLDGAETITFMPQERNTEAWAQVCAMLR